MIDYKNIKNLVLLLVILVPLIGFSQIPDGYYDGTEGLSGDDLREELSDIIGPHSSQSYSSLWDHFYDTDRKENGYVWDMYSDVPGGEPSYNYTFFSDQCGNYSGEGSCYNREHSFPKSWFGDQSPMNTDLYHLYPTDGYTNGQRSNYPFGETNNATWTSTNGTKKGACSYPGYSGTIFEPIDEYKGDFARTYFYMLTRYKSQVNNWNSPMLSGDDFSEWALNLLYEWHTNDTVSVKELNRNDEVYNIQNNRNPFIDYPGFAEDIWMEPNSINDYLAYDINIWYSDYTINLSSNEAEFNTIVIYDTSGRVVANYKIQSTQINLHQSLNNGIYLAKLNSNKAEILLKFAVVN